MKRLLLLPVLLALVLPAPAQAEAGQLDRGFGQAGKVVDLVAPRPALGGEFAAIAWAGQGKIVAVAADRLIEYLPSGKRNRDFGRNGFVSVRAPDGTLPRLSGLAVDSRGRILVAGTASESVFVARYLPGGRPDRSFGEAGSVVSDLGLPPPTVPPNLPSPGPVSPSSEPVVEATGLILDAADRPVLTGRWKESYQFCYLYRFPGKYTGFITRLDTSGALDQSFDSDGLRLTPEHEAAHAPVFDDGSILFVGDNPACQRASSTKPLLTRLAEDGTPDEAFGVHGEVELPFFERPRLILDRFGRKLLVGPSREGGPSTLLRLTRNGSVDSRFASGKGISLYFFDKEPALAVDGRGFVFLAGGDKIGRERWDLVLGRRTRDGRRDHDFARSGWATTRFKGIISPTQVLVGGNGRVLVGGAFTRGKAYGIALVRYLSR